MVTRRSASCSSHQTSTGIDGHTTTNHTKRRPGHKSQATVYVPIALLSVCAFLLMLVNNGRQQSGDRREHHDLHDVTTANTALPPVLKKSLETNDMHGGGTQRLDEEPEKRSNRLLEQLEIDGWWLFIEKRCRAAHLLHQAEVPKGIPREASHQDKLRTIERMIGTASLEIPPETRMMSYAICVASERRRIARVLSKHRLDMIHGENDNVTTLALEKELKSTSAVLHLTGLQVDYHSYISGRTPSYVREMQDDNRAGDKRGQTPATGDRRQKLNNHENFLMHHLRAIKKGIYMARPKNADDEDEDSHDKTGIQLSKAEIEYVTAVCRHRQLRYQIPTALGSSGLQDLGVKKSAVDYFVKNSDGAPDEVKSRGVSEFSADYTVIDPPASSEFSTTIPGVTTKQPVGILLYVHGCSHTSMDICPRESPGCMGDTDEGNSVLDEMQPSPSARKGKKDRKNTKRCVGLPEDVRIAVLGLRLGLRVVAVSSHNRNSHCWAQHRAVKETHHSESDLESAANNRATHFPHGDERMNVRQDELSSIDGFAINNIDALNVMMVLKHVGGLGFWTASAIEDRHHLPLTQEPDGGEPLLPIIAMGVSSGGGFVGSVLPKLLGVRLVGVIPQISAPSLSGVYRLSLDISRYSNIVVSDIVVVAPPADAKVDLPLTSLPSSASLVFEPASIVYSIMERDHATLKHAIANTKLITKRRAQQHFTTFRKEKSKKSSIDVVPPKAITLSWLHSPVTEFLEGVAIFTQHRCFDLTRCGRTPEHGEKYDLGTSVSRQLVREMVGGVTSSSLHERIPGLPLELSRKLYRALVKAGVIVGLTSISDEEDHNTTFGGGGGGGQLRESLSAKDEVTSSSRRSLMATPYTPTPLKTTKHHFVRSDGPLAASQSAAFGSVTSSSSSSTGTVAAPTTALPHKQPKLEVGWIHHDPRAAGQSTKWRNVVRSVVNEYYRQKQHKQGKTEVSSHPLSGRLLWRSLTKGSSTSVDELSDSTSNNVHHADGRQLQCANFDSLVADRSPISAALNVMYGYHETYSDHMVDTLSFIVEAYLVRAEDAKNRFVASMNAPHNA